MTAQPLSSLEDIEAVVTAASKVLLAEIERGRIADDIFVEAARAHTVADNARRIAFDDHRQALNAAERLRRAINEGTVK